MTSNGHHPVSPAPTAMVTPAPAPAPAAVLRQPRQPRPPQQPRRGHRSLGDLQELVRSKLPSKRPVSRKSDGKEYKLVRREYIY